MEHGGCCRTALSLTPLDKLRINVGAKKRHFWRLTILKQRSGYKEQVSGPDNLSKTERLRARDGGRC
jgi:hypothetical protein